MLLILLAAASATQAPLRLEWAHFQRSGALSRLSERVDIASGPHTADGFHYILRFTRRDFRNKVVVQWADSTTCPTIRPVIVSMHEIQMPAPAPYGVPGEPTTIVVDGTGYSLTVPSSDPMGEMTIGSNVGSSLAAWIDSALTRLAPCWTTKAP